MSDDIIDKLRNAPRRPDCKHGNRPKSCLECDIEELEGENTASMTEIANLRAENERMRDVLMRIGLPGKQIVYCRDGHEEVVLMARAALKENS